MVVTSRMYLESVEGISRGWFFLFLNGVRILSVTKSLCILNCFFFFFHTVLLAENARVKKTKC